MAEQIALTTPVEVFPHGTTPARAADHDHVVPYRSPAHGGDPGQTSTTNVVPLGRHHHRIKTHGPGWIHRQPAPGLHYWRTPHGHWARVDQHGTHTLGRHLDLIDTTLLDDHATPRERTLATLLLTTRSSACRTRTRRSGQVLEQQRRAVRHTALSFSTIRLTIPSAGIYDLVNQSVEIWG
jgi:hypothetical protein